MAQNVKSVCDVVIANVKSVCDVTNANVKSIVDVDNTSGGGGIAFDAVSNVSGDAGGIPGTTATLAHTCTGSDRALVVTVANLANGALTVTGATYNGVAATATLWQVDNSGGVEAKSVAFIWINPASGTNNIVVTWSGSKTGYAAVTGTSWTGVNQTGTVGNSWRAPITGGNGGGGTITLTASTAQNGDVVVQGIANWGTNIGTPSHNQRALSNNIAGGAYDASCQSAAVAGSTALTWTGGEYWSGGLVSLIPA